MQFQHTVFYGVCVCVCVNFNHDAYDKKGKLEEDGCEGKDFLDSQAMLTKTIQNTRLHAII